MACTFYPGTLVTVRPGFLLGGLVLEQCTRLGSEEKQPSKPETLAFSPVKWGQ